MADTKFSQFATAEDIEEFILVGLQNGVNKKFAIGLLSLLGYLKLSGTEIGKPVTGDVEIQDSKKILFTAPGYTFRVDAQMEGNNEVDLVFKNDDNTINGGVIFTTGSLSNTFQANGYGSGWSLSDGTLNINSDNPTFKGISGSQDFTPNIGPLDYTQKKYVDELPNGAVTDQDIEITDTNTGIILTAPNASRWRVKVDNAGVLNATPA